MPDNNCVVYAEEGGVARITLNRPEKRNALNDTLIAGIKLALGKVARNEEIRAVVVRGAGEDFCSGADLSVLQRVAAGSIADNVADASLLLELFILIRELSVPVIAAVEGRALAGGCGLATACDLVLASTTARFGYPEVKIGFVPAMVLAILRRNTSEKRAFELITRGHEIGADEAKQIGLVNQVFSEETFNEAVDEYVRKFTMVSRSAVALTKRLLYQIDGLAFVEALETGADVNVIARMTDDSKNGIARFLKK
jgi:methylglutaconyl-CoA hydratase